MAEQARGVIDYRIEKKAEDKVKAKVEEADKVDEDIINELLGD